MCIICILIEIRIYYVALVGTFGNKDFSCIHYPLCEPSHINIYLHKQYRINIYDTVKFQTHNMVVIECYMDLCKSYKIIWIRFDYNRMWWTKDIQQYRLYSPAKENKIGGIISLSIFRIDQFIYIPSTFNNFNFILRRGIFRFHFGNKPLCYM